MGLGQVYVTTGLFNTQESVRVLWLCQAGGVVIGHIVAVLLAHAVAVKHFGTGRAALLSQVPLDIEAVKTAANTLLEKGCEAVVVHFLHSYANPTHELQAVEVLHKLWPNDYITAGHALLSESREYERGVTAAVNASVQPVLSNYVDRLSHALTDQGYARDLLIMNGNGGMVSAQSVSKEAAKTVMSGPASGVMAAAFTGRAANEPNLITYDMGGTSTDVALIRDATPSVSNEIEVEYGMPIHVPMVDVRTVGAGGGSIAKINAGGLLEVGPESACATRGPV